MEPYNHWHDTLVPEMRTVIRGLLDPLCALLLSLACKEERAQWCKECKRPLDESFRYLLGGFATPDFYERYKPAGPMDMVLAGAAAREGNLTLLQHMTPPPRAKSVSAHLGVLALLYDQYAVRQWIKNTLPERDRDGTDLYAYALAKTANGHAFAVDDFIRALQRYNERQRRRKEKLAAIPQRRLELKAEEQQNEQLLLTAHEHDARRRDLYKRQEALREKENALRWGLQDPMPIHWRTLARTNNVAALAYLREHREAVAMDTQAVDAVVGEAVKTRQWSVIRWVLEAPAPMGGPRGSAVTLLGHRHRAILQGGDLPFCQWLHTYMPWNPWDVELARDAGQEQLAEWLESLFKDQ